jgi:hypothetical protein
MYNHCRNIVLVFLSGYDYNPIEKMFALFYQYYQRTEQNNTLLSQIKRQMRLQSKCKVKKKHDIWCMQTVL